MKHLIVIAALVVPVIVAGQNQVDPELDRCIGRALNINAQIKRMIQELEPALAQKLEQRMARMQVELIESEPTIQRALDEEIEKDPIIKRAMTQAKQRARERGTTFKQEMESEPVLLQKVERVVSRVINRAFDENPIFAQKAQKLMMQIAQEEPAIMRILERVQLPQGESCGNVK